MVTSHQVARGVRHRKIKTCNTKQLYGCPQRKGVVSKIKIVAPKKPNSARRKVAKIRLSTGANVTARLIGQGHNLQSYSHVLVRGGRANDIPGVRYTMVKGVLDFGWEETLKRFKSRSKYGISLDHIRGRQ